MIVTGASLTETKMWAAVRENGDFSRSWIMSKRINMFEFFSPSQYSTVVLTVVRVMIAKYKKSGIWGYRSSLTPEPIELK